MSARTTTTVTKQVIPQTRKSVANHDVNVGTPYVAENVKLQKRKGITIFRYVQIRRYAYVPSDFLILLKKWFEKEHFVIKKNTRGYGHLAGRREGIHLNFVPKFLIQVKQEEDHQMVTLTYCARVRKLGIASAVVTQGITAIVGAATLTAHVARARQTMESITEQMDRVAGVCLGVQWCEAVEGGKEVTTTTTEHLPAQVPIPPAPKEITRSVATPPPAPAPPAPAPAMAPTSVVVAAAPQRETVQPQIIVVQTPAPQMPMMPMMYPMMGYPNMYPPHMMGYPNAYPPHMSMPQQQLPSVSLPPPPTVTERPTMLSNTRYPVYEPAQVDPSSLSLSQLQQQQFQHFDAGMSVQQPITQSVPVFNSQPMYQTQPAYNTYTHQQTTDISHDFATKNEYYTSAPLSAAPVVPGMAGN